jgi:hypothetical protein
MVGGIRACREGPWQGGGETYEAGDAIAHSRPYQYRLVLYLSRLSLVVSYLLPRRGRVRHLVMPLIHTCSQRSTIRRELIVLWSYG